MAGWTISAAWQNRSRRLRSRRPIAEIDRYIKAERKRWSEVVKDLGLAGTL